ncbi:uncharacterized protein METZ01_LOCUS167248, partial [marine metagenome]
PASSGSHGGDVPPSLPSRRQARGL